MLSFVFVMFMSLPAPCASIDEHVDMIELNHFFDQKGCHVFDQVIFYEIDPSTQKPLVRAWCLIDDREMFNRRPVLNVESGLYRVHWEDRDNHSMRRVYSRMFRESWSQDDPERSNKKLLEEQSRYSLIRRDKKLGK